ncbi:MAG: MarR family transcriptional regulator [Clostridiaceae bacterium]|nr:MarR family transcriptional regulator [Clostridiaceae bacterium]
MAQDRNELRELLRILERRLGMIDDNAKSCCGITMTQCHALVEIGRAGSVSLSGLADLLGLDKSTVSRTVDLMVKGGQVARRLDEQNRRLLVIRLTGKGQLAYQCVENGMNRHYQQIQAAIPQEKKETVLESLRLLVSAVSQIETDDENGCTC